MEVVMLIKFGLFDLINSYQKPTRVAKLNFVDFWFESNHNLTKVALNQIFKIGLVRSV